MNLSFKTFMKDYTFTNVNPNEKDIFEDESFLNDYQFNLSAVIAEKDWDKNNISTINDVFLVDKL